MESRQSESSGGPSHPRASVQKAALNNALKTFGVVISDETLNMLPFKDLHSIYSCVAVNFEQGSNGLK